MPSSTAHPVRIWFNRPFATSYWLFHMLRDNPDGYPVKIYATQTDPTSPVFQGADYGELEPDLQGNAYVDWALDFCERHGIELFFPRKWIELIVEAEDRFAALGVKLIASSPKAIRLFEDKNLTYRAALEAGVAVPPWRVASDAESFERELHSLQAELESSDRIVVKPTVGVGAQGFRILDEKPRTINRILEGGLRVSSGELIEGYERAEAAGETLPELMLLPYLEEPELSVDCLNSPEGELLKTIPRAKLSGRQRLFTDEYPEAVELVERLYAGRDLRYITNTQLRWWRGQLVLLETNTRPAGGLYATSLTGVNLIWDAVALALRGEATPKKPRLVDSYVALESFTELKVSPHPSQNPGDNR